ncbi:MAG: hypothetical protein KME20_16640 [Kaiparowitsia implicata GSE-PSE-MK54-09C]|nr:hypothetical protein [Kaiparowitsia implicata GSE-PSE-MK54-09C]
MGYTLPHSNTCREHHRRGRTPERHILETERQVLRHRISEIDEELYEIARTPQQNRIDDPGRAVAQAAQRSKFEETIESIFAVVVSFGALGGLLLLLL